MKKIELISKAIENAKNNSSKLSEEILQLPSFSSAKIKHLMNNLGAFSEKYLEVGVHKGGLFVSTLFKNESIGIAIDNWSQFEQNGLSKKEFYQNVHKLNAGSYTIYEQDCFTVPVKEIANVDLYLYDGEHSTENQKKGLVYFYESMADEFIFCCDDASWEGPREGTKQAIQELGCEILFEEFLWDGMEGGQWHNGYLVYLLKKRK